MGWIFLGLGTLGLLHGLNARHPIRDNPVLFVPSFFASWLTIELALHHLVIGALLIVGFVAAGVLDSAAGWAGLVLMVASEVLLVSIALMARRTVVIVHGALEELEPGPEAPTFPRHLVVLPFLMKRRKGVSVRRNVTFARVGGRKLRLDVTLPTAPVPGGGTRRPALMQIHGGGWVIGDKREQGIPLLNHMAAQGWVGFNVNYRLCPGVSMADQVADLKRGLAWIREHADEYGIDPDFICVTGGSAGGHLTALMALEPDTHYAAAVPFYGVYDLTPESRFGHNPRVYSWFLEPYVVKAFVADEPEVYRDLSPVHHVRADAPPFLVVHGDKDVLAPVEDARVFVERLRAVSHEPVLYAEMQGAQHAFEIFPSYRTARVIEGVERFLTAIWERRHQREEPAEAVEAELADALTD